MTDPFAALRAEYPGRFASPERIAELSRERFKPWPLYQPAGAQPQSGIVGADRVKFERPGVAHLGFVSNSRFAGGTEPVIQRTNRTKTRQFRSSVDFGGAK